MKPKYKNYLIKLMYVLIDLFCIVASIYLACVIRAGQIPIDSVSIYNVFFNPENAFRFIFVFWVITNLLVLNSKLLYQTRREASGDFEIAALMRAIVFASLIVIVAIFGLKIQGFPRTILFIGSGLIICILSVWRLIKRLVVEYMVAHGYNNFNAIIIGAGKIGAALSQEIQKRPGVGIKIVGYLDDFKTNDTSDGMNILGKIADFKCVAKRKFIDKVFITVHHDSKVFLKILEESKELGVAVRVIPQGFELISGEFSKYNIGIIPILEYSDIIPLRIQVGKRLFDFFMSLIGTVVLLPVFMVFALIIKLDSRGRIFYISKRYGRNGRIFNMYKFRSMSEEADKLQDQFFRQNEVDGPIFKMKNDPRVTNAGKILRKFSLDELPQIFNVLKGDMSLVGPRPLPIDQIEEEDLQQLKRLEVRPGITGLWQVRGRSDISFRRLVKWDMWYINNWSLWLDLNILLRTIPVVMRGKGAY